MNMAFICFTSIMFHRMEFDNGSDDDGDDDGSNGSASQVKAAPMSAPC